MNNNITDMVDQSIEKIDTLYSERSLWARAKLLVTGIRAPRSTKLYKEARIELQRLSAFVSAVFFPLLSAILLFIMTQDNGLLADAHAIEVEVLDENTNVEELEQVLTPEDERPDEDMSIQDISMPTAEAIAEAEAVFAPAAPSPMVLPVQAGLVRKPIHIAGLGRAGLGSAFGSTNQIKGDLTGYLYDFKRDAKGNPRTVNYWEDLKRMVSGKLSDRSVREFYRVPKNIYLSHLFVPYTKAEVGPEAFGVGGLMEPKGWVARYSGFVQPPTSGRYRFVGDFDDVLIVMIDGKVVLEVTWDHPDNAGGATGWKPKENVGAHRCFTSRPFIYGDWVELSNTEKRRIDILVGERPGGMIGGVLLIQKEGVKYATEANGRPVLPIFAVSLLSPLERARMTDFKSLAFDKSVPMMGVIGDGSARANAMREDKDIEVLSGDL